MKLGIQVFGQLDLVEHLNNGGKHYSHCISIGNPKRLFHRVMPDERMPEMLKNNFREILRLKFYDVEEKRHLRTWQFPKKIPRKSDIRKVIKFYHRTNGTATGYTIHCWRGVSRSPAIALGLLFLISGSEIEAKNQLKRIVPKAGPHQKLVKWFDEELGCDLTTVNEEIRGERLELMKQELAQLEDSLLEELPIVAEE